MTNRRERQLAKKKAACKVKMSDNQRRLLSIAISDGIGLAHKLGYLPEPAEHLPGVPLRRGGMLSGEHEPLPDVEMKYELDNARFLLDHLVSCCDRCHTVERSFVTLAEVKDVPPRQCDMPLRGAVKPGQVCNGFVNVMSLRDALALWGLTIHRPRKPRR